MNHLLGLVGVVAAEQMVVIEDVVEVVEIAALRPVGMAGVGLVVSLIEGWREAAEEFGEGEVGFAVAVVTDGIEDHRSEILVECGVAAPEVAVEKGWCWLIVPEEDGQEVEKFVAAGKAEAFVCGELELPAEAVNAPEGDPVLMGFIRLRGGTDVIGAGPAEEVIWRGVTVEFGQGAAHGGGLGGWVLGRRERCSRIR